MMTFDVTVDLTACYTMEVEAETQEEAYEKAQALLNSDDADLFEKIRRNCDFADATVWKGN